VETWPNTGSAPNKKVNPSSEEKTIALLNLVKNCKVVFVLKTEFWLVFINSPNKKSSRSPAKKLAK
jgi:hypothetical protein